MAVGAAAQVSRKRRRRRRIGTGERSRAEARGGAVPEEVEETSLRGPDPPPPPPGQRKGAVPSGSLETLARARGRGRRTDGRTDAALASPPPNGPWCLGPVRRQLEKEGGGGAERSVALRSDWRANATQLLEVSWDHAGPSLGEAMDCCYSWEIMPPPGPPVSLGKAPGLPVAFPVSIVKVDKCPSPRGAQAEKQPLCAHRIRIIIST